MRYENFIMDEKNRKEVLEAMLKAKQLNQNYFNDVNALAQKQAFPKNDIYNPELSMLLSFTEDAFEELEETNEELALANKKLATQNVVIQNYSKRQEDKIEKLKFAYHQLEHLAQVGSHDLKEPLRNISNFSQLLNEQCSDSISEEGKTYLQFILKGVNQLNNTLNDFIDYLQIDSQFNEAEIVDLNGLLKLIATELKLQFGENAFELKVEKLPSIAVNPILFKRLIKELIVNAIKFKHIETPKIEVSCDELEDGYWLFKVKDNGVGIDNKLSDKIFTPFQRITSTKNNDERPIGLAVCQKIVKLHKGDIWYDSTGVAGEGTTFLFTINNIATQPFEKNIVPGTEYDSTVIG